MIGRKKEKKQMLLEIVSYVYSSGLTCQQTLEARGGGGGVRSVVMGVGICHVCKGSRILSIISKVCGLGVYFIKMQNVYTIA